MDRSASTPYGPAPGRGRFWTATRIILALCCLTLALHWVQKSPCQDGDWQKNIQYTRFCYTDVLALYYAEGLNEGKVPYRDHPVEYPVVTGYFMGALGLPVHALGEQNPSINQGSGSTTPTRWCSPRWPSRPRRVILALRRRRPWDAAIFALSPILFVTATVNWDFLAIGLAAFGLYAWAKTTTGPGRGAARARRRGEAVAAVHPRPAARAGAALPAASASGRCAFVAAVVAWVAVNAPVFLLYRESWDRFFDLNTERPIDWGTLWYIGRFLDTKWNTGAAGDQGPFQWLSDHVPTLNTLSYALFVLACVGDRGAEPARAAPAPAGPGGVPGGRRVPDLQQGLVAAVRALAAPADRAGPAAVGRVHGLEGGRVGYFTAFYAELLGAGGKPVIPEGTFVLASSLRLVTVAVLCGW